MASIGGAGGVGGDSAVASVEAEPRQEVASVEKEETDDHPGPAADPGARIPTQPETAAPTLYDPTPVLRGYATPDCDAHECSSAQPAADPTPAASTIVETRQHVPATTTEAEVSATQLADRQATPLNENPPPKALEAAQAAVVDPLKSRVRDTWSLMFGSRYEDEDDAEKARSRSIAAESEHSSRPTAAPSDSVRPSSVRSKLDLGRQLDQQLQGRRTRVRQRPGSSTVAESEKTSSTTRSSSQKPRPTKAEETWRAEENPFHDAGLTATIVRFCLEKSTLSTVYCIAQLHAIAQDEPEPARGDIEPGLFLTQWELDTILRTLFETAATASSSSSSSSCSHSQMCLHNAEYEALPLETLLQVSWFLPLDEFTRQRSLVAQISRKHLSERKLAVFNAALHRHFVLRPHPGTKMQRLLLRILEALMPRQTTRRPTGNQAASEESDKESATLREESRALVVELLHAIYVRIPLPSSLDLLTVYDFMRLTPFELVSTLQLTSVVAVQRIVFFRFLIEALASEKANRSVGVNSWWPRSNGKPSDASRLHQRRASKALTEDATTPRRSVAKSKKTRKKEPDEKVLKSTQPSDQQDELCTDTDSEAPAKSTHASDGSAGSRQNAEPQETTLVQETAVESSRSEFNELHGSLTAALASLVKAQPWLVDDKGYAALTSPSAAAIRASFLAAEAFQQSLALLASAGSSPSSSVVQKIQEFTDSINELTRQREANTAPPPEYEEPPQPTPRREVTKPIPPAVQRGDSTSSIFPPPYIATTPSYWTFDPQLPPPSTPKDDASVPRSVAKAKASPGVGDYDLSRSDKLTSVQRKGFTFAKSGLEPVVESGKSLTPKKNPRTGRVDSNDPPAYTHWASAAVEDDRKPVSTMTERLLLDDEDDDEDHDVETRVREALRIQQSFVLDDMVQSLLQRDRPVVSTFTGKTPSTPKPQSARRQPQSRVVSRVRTATATTRPSREPQPPVYTKKPRPTKPPAQEIHEPPRDFEPPADDAHLQWAARVSQFYQAKLKAVVASTGSL